MTLAVMARNSSSRNSSVFDGIVRRCSVTCCVLFSTYCRCGRLRGDGGSPRGWVVNVLSLYSISIAERSLSVIRLQRGPSVVHHLLPCFFASTRDMPCKGSAGKERGERRPTTPPHATPARVPSPPQTPRGLPPAKDRVVIPPGSGGLRVAVAWYGRRCLCPTREGTPSRIRLLVGIRCLPPQRRSRERPHGGHTPVYCPTSSGSRHGRRCLCQTRELPSALRLDIAIGSPSRGTGMSPYL